MSFTRKLGHEIYIQSVQGWRPR